MRVSHIMGNTVGLHGINKIVSCDGLKGGVYHMTWT